MKKKYQGCCHCGVVKFSVQADLDHVRVCDCSLCRKRGALNFRVEESDFELISSLDEITFVPIAELCRSGDRARHPTFGRLMYAASNALT
ncbi:MAG: hypothetical protein ACJAX5_002161 [Patiriisocius sp.]|jgi:hypothetical protein